MVEVQVTAQAYLRRDQRWSELERLRTGSPMYDAVIDEIRGRRIRIGDHWLTDFASCNYLGFDLDPEIMGGSDQKRQSGHRGGSTRSAPRAGRAVSDPGGEPGTAGLRPGATTSALPRHG